MKRKEYIPDAGNYNVFKDFKSLKAWTQCRKVKLFFYGKILVTLPAEEKYILGTQIRRAAISITANIAEGYGRYHYQEGKQYFRIARSSLYELKDHLISCSDLGYISSDLYYEGVEIIESAKMILNGFINYIDKQASQK